MGQMNILNPYINPPARCMILLGDNIKGLNVMVLAENLDQTPTGGPNFEPDLLVSFQAAKSLSASERLAGIPLMTPVGAISGPQA